MTKSTPKRVQLAGGGSVSLKAYLKYQKARRAKARANKPNRNFKRKK